jgi:hypothetical protein
LNTLAYILIAEGGAGNLIFIVIMVVAAIASKIVAAKRERDQASRQENQPDQPGRSILDLDDEDSEEVINAADKLPGEILMPPRRMESKSRPAQTVQQVPHPHSRPEIVTQQQHSAPMPQRRPGIVEVSGATSQILRRPEVADATGARHQMDQANRQHGVADVGGATGQMIRRPNGTAAQPPTAGPQVRQVAKPAMVPAKTMDMRVEEELQRQKRRLEQDDAQRNKRMHTQAPQESKTEAIEARILHIRKPDIGQLSASEAAVHVNLLSANNARHAMLLHEIFSPCKALREEADLPGLR